MMVVHLSIFSITFIIQHLLFDILIALTYINIVTHKCWLLTLIKISSKTNVSLNKYFLSLVSFMAG